jgi:hypothetical protein
VFNISPRSVTSSLNAKVSALWQTSASSPMEDNDGAVVGLSDELGLARDKTRVLLELSVVERLAGGRFAEDG